jgi:hypothetical protein
MMHKTARWLGCVLAIMGIATWALAWRPSAVPPGARADAPGATGARGAPDTDLDRALLDRFWVDQLPTDPWSTSRGYVFGEREDRGERFGIAMTFTHYRFAVEVFQFRIEGDHLHMTFPDTGEHRQTAFAVREEQHDEFDSVLTLGADPRKGGRGQRYYSREAG